jgi:hypothetical protein
MKITSKESSTMCRIKAKVVNGAIDAEKVAYVKTVGGEIAEVVVATSQVIGNTIVVGEVGRDKDKILVEFPRETARGSWRAWVNRKQLVG